jgi:phosphate transport system protein
MNIQQGHISKEYNDELEQLRLQVLSMGGLVEEHFKGATDSLLKGEIVKAQNISKNDFKVNAMEVEIDEGCSNVIARRQPAAIDLRNVFAVIKIVTDLERIGDESQKIAKFASELKINIKTTKFYTGLKKLAKNAINMLSSALNCYARLDVDKATKVVQMDSTLDNEFADLNLLLTNCLIEDKKNIEDILKVMWCARSIERVGDHAKNICQYVVYVAHGNDVRHGNSE